MVRHTGVVRAKTVEEAKELFRNNLKIYSVRLTDEFHPDGEGKIIEDYTWEDFGIEGRDYEGLEDIELLYEIPDESDSDADLQEKSEALTEALGK